MDDYSKFWPAVCDEYKRGSTPEEAFQNICKQNGLNPPSYETTAEFMNRLYDKDFGELISHIQRPFYEKVRSAVIGQYLKFKHAISFQKVLNPNSYDIILNNRFKFDADLDSFTITDLFNKEIRGLRIPSIDRTVNLDWTMAQVDHDLVLIFSFFNDGYRHLLLQFDFNSQTVLILDNVKSESFEGKVITDPTNCSKFAYLNYSGEYDETGLSFNGMLKGRIVNNRIILDNRQINFNCDLHFCKLEDGKILGFRGIDTENGFDWQFCEFSPDIGQIVKSSKTEFPDFFDPRYEDQYIWSKDKLYIPHSRGSSFVIIVFDAETCKWTQTKAVAMGDYSTLSVNEDEVLTVSAYEGPYEKRVGTVYRFPMKKSDKLKYLAWSTILRASIFFESDLYERLLPRLPLNSEFRPFAEDYFYNIECDMEEH